MIVELEYGRGRLSVRMPDTCEVTVLRKNPLPVIEETTGAVERAFAEPVAAPPLATLARGKRSACILVCDITRPVPNHVFLGPMIHTLVESGIPARNITVLVATGLHRPNEGEELEELIGDRWVLDTVRVENHFARDAAAHIDLGVTATRGTPVRLDRRFVDADLRIATGLVEPHFMAGWSGGRKVVAPGVAHEDTIRTFHNARFMEDPAAIQCNLDGNPLHEEQLEIMRMLGDLYALNTVIDERRRLCFVNFGEIVESHREAVRFVHDSCVVPVDRRFRTVVTSAAGYPLDRTYYQTVKGMVTPIDILAPGRESHHRLRLLRGNRFAPVPGGPAPARRGRPRRIPRRHPRQAARGHRRMADRDAAQADAPRRHSPVLAGPAGRGPGADRRERRRFDRGCDRPVRRVVGRSGGRGDSGGTVRGAPVCGAGRHGAVRTA